MHQPLRGEIDAVEQRLGGELCGLSAPADRFHDCGCHKSQAPETVDVTLAKNFIPRDFGELVRTAGRQLVKPRPRTRYSFER